MLGKYSENHYLHVKNQIRLNILHNTEVKLDLGS